MKSSRLITITASILIVLGVAGLAPLAYFHLQAKQALAKAPTVQVPAVAPRPTTKPATITGKPVHLMLPSLGLDLQVADGVYNAMNGTWTLSKDKAHYALPTVQPNNDTGNTLIYGHYRPEVFARLHTIKDGASAIVETDNGYRFSYTFQRSETVDPSDTSIFTYQGPPRLTIQTCTGAFMQNRQLYYFNFAGVAKL